MQIKEKHIIGPPRSGKSEKKQKKKIRRSVLEEFVCNNVDKSVIKLLYRIDQHPVAAHEFRINVWTTCLADNLVVPSTKIASSFFVELLPNGEIVDRTINVKTSQKLQN